MFLQLVVGTSPFTSFPLEIQLFFLLLIKIIFIIGALIYLIFSFVVVRQIHVMKSTVITPFSVVIQLVGYAHLVFAFGVLLMFITLL